jgi:hypothetical protein
MNNTGYTTITITNEDEQLMFETAIENAEYIFTETKSEQKILKFIRKARGKFSNPSRSFPFKVRITKKQCSAIYDALEHDRQYVQGETKLQDIEDGDEDAIYAHRLCQAYDKFKW